MPYRPMSEDEVWAFLSLPVRPAILATTRSDGRPHAAPVWYDLDGHCLVFTTGAQTAKGRNLRRDPRAVLVVQDDQPPFAFVQLEGTVTISTELDDVAWWAGRLGGRYMGVERAGEYARRNGVPGELLVRFTAVKMVSAKNLAE